LGRWKLGEPDQLKEKSKRGGSKGQGREGNKRRGHGRKKERLGGGFFLGGPRELERGDWGEKEKTIDE